MYYYSEEIEEEVEAVELSNMYSEEIEEEAVDLSKMEEGRGGIRGSSSTNPPVDDGALEDEYIYISFILKKLDSVTLKGGGFPKDYCIHKRRTQQEQDEYLQAQTSRPYYVSIGPYYHGDSDLARTENVKWKCLRKLTINMSAETREAFLKGCLRGLKKLEEQVRKFYLEDEQTKKMTTNEFVEMLLLDGSFILMVVVRMGYNKSVKEIGQFFSVEDKYFWRSRFRHDLLLTDNQIPFYIIEYMYVRFEEYKWPSSSCVVAEFDFLQSYLQREHPQKFITPMLWFFELYDPEKQRIHNESFLHILHFYHHSTSVDIKNYLSRHKLIEDVPSATELEKVGMKFQLKKGYCSFLDITFKGRILKIPEVIISLHHKGILQNMLDFEESSPDFPPSVTHYLRFMENLLKNTSDAEILIRAGIVRNEIGSVDDIPKFFSDLLLVHTRFTIPHSLLEDINTIPHPLFEDINKYHASKLALWKGALVRSYRNNPWIILSMTAGSMILIMTFLQTFYTMFSYHHPTN